MNRILIVFVISVFLVTSIHAHGPGHLHRAAGAEVNRALDIEAGGVTPARHAHGDVSASGKTLKQPVTEIDNRWWGASLTTGWESRHIHYGVNETGDSGAYITELGVWIDNFTFNVWGGFGTGSDFQKWDFTVAYNLDLGPVFLIPGYNFRYTPGFAEEGHTDEEEHHDEEGHADEEEHHDEAGHEEEEHSEHGHVHKTYGNELFFVLGTNKIPYITPTVNFIWDLSNTPGAFLEFRIDGDIPVYRDILSVRPYALLGLNFGYNTRSYYGWNNFQFGLQGDWKINRNISAFAGVNYSVAMTALDEIGQGNEVWANVGVSFTY